MIVHKCNLSLLSLFQNNELKESFAKSKPKVNPPDVEIKAEDIIVDVNITESGFRGY